MGMTRREKRLLRECIRSIIRSRKEEWWTLKRQIWDLGYASYYEAQGDFLWAAERAIFNLDPSIKNELLDEWNKTRPTNKIDFSSFQSAYTLLVLEEIIERARVGAMRTYNWD